MAVACREIDTLGALDRGIAGSGVEDRTDHGGIEGLPGPIVDGARYADQRCIHLVDGGKQGQIVGEDVASENGAVDLDRIDDAVAIADIEIADLKACAWKKARCGRDGRGPCASFFRAQLADATDGENRQPAWRGGGVIISGQQACRWGAILDIEGRSLE